MNRPGTNLYGQPIRPPPACCVWRVTPRGVEPPPGVVCSPKSRLWLTSEPDVRPGVDGARIGLVVRRFQGGSRSGQGGGILSRGSRGWEVPSCIFEWEDRSPRMPIGAHGPAHDDRFAEAAKRVERVFLQPESKPEEYQLRPTGRKST